MTRDEFTKAFPGIAYPFDDNDEDDGHDTQRWKARHRLGNGYEKRLGKNVEVYQQRAPKAKGKLVGYDERYGKITVKTDEGEVDLMLSSVIQVRWLPD